MKGKVISAEEVKARWGYAEINSERFGKTYQANLPQPVFDGARAGVPFDQVHPSEHTALVNALMIARNGDFVDNIDVWGAPQYEWVEWDAPDLLNSIALPVFFQVPYFVFLARPPGRDEAGRPDDADPRLKSHSISFDEQFRVTDALIAIAVDGKRMLIEGYLRSILWLRNPVQPLPVWVPKP